MTIFARGAALIALAAAATAPTLAQSSDVARAGFLPPFEAITAIRSLGFDPAGAPRLRGPVYIVRAYDENIPVRVTVDARTGRVLTVTELFPGEDFSTPARVGSHPIPPGRVASVPGYRPPPGYGPPVDARPAAVTPSPNRAVAARTPTPRARPATAAVGDAVAPAAQATAPAKPEQATASVPPLTTGSIPESKPGKSIPAPVAPSAAKAGSSTDEPAGEHAAKQDTPMVPVAPLE